MSGDHTLAAAISAVEDVTKEPGVNEPTAASRRWCSLCCHRTQPSLPVLTDCIFAIVEIGRLLCLYAFGCKSGDVRHQPEITGYSSDV